MAMVSEDIEKRIRGLVLDAELEIVGADCDFSVTVISDSFEGLSTMKRQQKILSGFSDVLSSGELHALSIKAYTLDEWNSKSSHLVQISL